MWPLRAEFRKLFLVDAAAAATVVVVVVVAAAVCCACLVGSEHFLRQVVRHHLEAVLRTWLGVSGGLLWFHVLLTGQRLVERVRVARAVRKALSLFINPRSHCCLAHQEGDIK
jgi:hypothetical protein